MHCTSDDILKPFHTVLKLWVPVHLFDSNLAEQSRLEQGGMQIWQANFVIAGKSNVQPGNI